jgi:hypothetical protein
MATLLLPNSMTAKSLTAECIAEFGIGIRFPSNHLGMHKTQLHHPPDVLKSRKGLASHRYAQRTLLSIVGDFQGKYFGQAMITCNRGSLGDISCVEVSPDVCSFPCTPDLRTPLV